MAKKESEIEKAQQQFDAFEKNVKDLTLDRMNETAKQETESQTKMSTKEQQSSKDIYLKPERVISCREKFNEKYRDKYNYDKEYVQFVGENKEIIGEAIELWTKPYAGVPAEFWKVPVNKPVWGPRYLAEQIKRACYHRFAMQQGITTGADGMGQYFGGMVVDTTVQRLDAVPVNKRKSVFMGASSF